MYGCRFNRLSDYLLCVCLFAIFGFSIDAQAQMSGDTANELGKWWQASTSGFKTVPAQTPGSFVVPFNAGPAGVPGEVSIRPSAGSWPDAASRVTPRGIPGGPVIDVVAKVSPAAAAKAIGNLAVKLAFPLQIGLAVVDLLAELNVSASPGANGTTFSQTQSGFYWDTLANSGMFVARFATKDEACALAISRVGGGMSCFDQSETDFGVLANGGSRYYGLGHRTSIPVQSVAVLSRQQFEDMIAARSGWPAGSAIGRAIQDAVKAGEVVGTDPAVISGPASSPPKVSTSVKADGTTSKTTTTNNYNYAGNNVAVTTVTNVENYNPVTNVTTTDTTVASGPGEVTKPTECEANPNSVGCSEKDNVPEGVIPKETKNVAYAVESLNWGVSAGCPSAMSFNAPVTGKSFQLEYTPFCDIASRMRPFILAGAAFVAMMIVMAGVKA